MCAGSSAVCTTAGDVVIDGRAYGLYPGFPNPAELELADVGPDGLVYGVICYPGLAKVRPYTSTVGTFDTGGPGVGHLTASARPAVPAHKYRSANFVPPRHSAFTYPDLLVCLHNGHQTKLVAAVVDFASVGFDDSQRGR